MMNHLKLFFAFALVLLLAQAPLTSEEKKKVKLDTVGLLTDEGGQLFFKPNDLNLPSKIHLLKEDIKKYENLTGKKVSIKGTAKLSENYSLFVWIAKVTPKS